MPVVVTAPPASVVFALDKIVVNAAPPPTTPWNTTRPDPVSVKLCAPLTVPFKLSTSAVICVPMVLSVPSVILPFHVAVPLPTNAPAELIPEPFNVNAKVGVSEILLSRIAAPLLTVTPDVCVPELPSASALDKFNVPPVTLVAPV